ncbi:hypothetical protein RUND412_002694 [Rhizina undulata]
MLAETGSPLRMDQQGSPQVVPAMYQEVKIVDVAPVEEEVRMVTGPTDMGIMPVETSGDGGGSEKEEREEMNRQYRRRFD